MKKTLLWILAICVLVTIVGSMAACNLFGKNEGNDTEVQTDDDGTDLNLDDGVTPGDETPADGGVINTDTVQTERMKTRSEITTKLGFQYYIKARSLTGTGVAEVGSNGTYTYFTRPTPTFIKTSGNKTYVYSDLRDDEKYYAVTLDPNYATDPLAGGNVANIFLYEGATISYHAKTDVTFAGRTAYKYVYVNAAGGNEEIVIDKYSGLCMKHDGKNAETDGFTSGAAKASFELANLEIGTGAKTTVDGIVAKAAIEGWDTAWFQAVGLNISTLQVLGGDFISAAWAHNSTRTSNNAEWVATYRIASATPTTQRTKIRSVMRSFYDAGANYNDSHEHAAFDVAGLYHEEWEDEVLVGINFSGRIFGDAGSYSVVIDATYVGNVAAPYWEVTYCVEAY